MTKLILISDDHGSWSKTIKILNFQTYDLAIHLGDSLVSQTTIAKYFDYYVAGNNDDFTQDKLIFTIEGLTFVILHGHQLGFIYGPNAYKKLLDFAQSSQAQIIIYGHTHIPQFEQHGSYWIVNPGSTALPRSQFGPTYALLTIDGTRVLNFELKKI